MVTDKIRPYNDARISYRSAHLNGVTYGYIYSPRSTLGPNRGTIFLIHGFPDISLGWRYQIPFLTSLGLDVIALDCIGYGRTDSPRFNLSYYTYKRIATDIRTLCAQLSLSQIILGGHDWGGAIVYRVAQYYPALVTAVFSICTPFFLPSAKYEPLAQLMDKRLPNFAYQLHYVSGEIEEAVHSMMEIRQFLDNIYGGRTSDGRDGFDAEKGIDLGVQREIGKNQLLNEEEMKYYVAEFARHGLNGPLNWYRSREENYVNEWRDFFLDGNASEVEVKKRVTIRCEVLFVLATNDNTLKSFMAERMAERIPKLTRREVATGHWALWQKPDDVNRLIGDWLKEKVFPQSERESKL
ncbi:uncharacterized protein A1O5_07352 [Cladophialophora psammophila CBS 110553]|uniref:AB hydrolase-1 domain-containing protein n=1 Tax=Cladophialophora psammophila CBS 110553 TaxID=1182543 RepID=W9WXC7_9EURO|nr:uncharacterized protein A1O5_07352 [Cladophialophora psammophila CBS 110553]EXJ69316.1 hypothetical protein A1O5_07352 [Cladophialophora psammophila CBS 110553]